MASATCSGSRRWGLSCFGLLLLASPTAQERREPGPGLTDDRLVSSVMVARNGALLPRWLDRCPAATSRRAAEPSASEADHGTVGSAMVPHVVMCAHGPAA
jgi:hypothetical protein